MKNFDKMAGSGDLSHKPRIMDFVESFEAKYKDDLRSDILTETACLAVALYFFGPLEDDEISIYATIINKRVHEYRLSIN